MPSLVVNIIENFTSAFSMSLILKRLSWFTFTHRCDVKESTAEERRLVLRRKTFLIRKVSHTHTHTLS